MNVTRKKVIASMISLLVLISIYHVINTTNLYDRIIVLNTDKISIESTKESNCSVPTSFFKLTARDTIDMDVPEYIPNLRNPCFYANTEGLRHLSPSEKKRKCRLTCLPLVYVAGVTKSGTTDFHHKLVAHQHIIGGIDKEAHFWNLNEPNDTARYTMGRYTDLYQLFASVIENCYLRNNTECKVSPFTPTGGNGRVVNKYRDALRDLQNRLDDGLANDITARRDEGSPCPLVTVDSTPCSIYNANFWHLDPHNRVKKEPNILTANRIHHFVSNAKAILLLRNPVERTVSDYRFFTGKYVTAEKFHNAVKTGIEWWMECIEKHSENICAFGNDYQKYGLKSISTKTFWTENAANRIRISIYIIFIKRWLDVFPNKNVLILNSDQFRKNPNSYLQRKVYPFLELEPMSNSAKNRLNRVDRGYTHETTWSRDFKPFPETLDILKQFYEPYNRRLIELTGDSFLAWS